VDLFDFANRTLTRIVQTTQRVQQPAARAFGIGGAFGGSGSVAWLARIVENGPANEADFSDERYWVREIEILGATNGKWCVGDKSGGRHVVASHITEMGAADVLDANPDSGVSMSEDADPCTAFVTSGGGSVEVTGRTYDGAHLIAKTPARILYDVPRIVEVKSARTRGGTVVYYFASSPSPIIPASYVFDETCLADGCPDGEHWAGYLTGFAVTDDQAGDEMPECGA
jgi:hypothetical protein